MLKIILIIFIQSFTFIYSQSDEKLVKAVFIERISPFIIWPEESNIEDKDTPFVIGCWGGGSFCDVLSEVYESKAIFSKRVKVLNIRKIENIKECNVLFIPKVNSAVLTEMVEISYQYPVLLISDTPGYAQKGVHINLFIENDNLGFEINEKSVKESGIHLSHLLLELARVIGGR